MTYDKLNSILFYESYESKISAQAILSEQIFSFSKEDFLEIQQMWNGCKYHSEKCPYYEDIEKRKMMKDEVSGFKSNLKPKTSVKKEYQLQTLRIRKRRPKANIQIL